MTGQIDFVWTISLGEVTNFSVFAMLAIAIICLWYRKRNKTLSRVMHLEKEIEELKIEINLIMHALKIRADTNDERS